MRPARDVTKTHRAYLKDGHDLDWLHDQLRPLLEQIHHRLDQATRGHHDNTANFCQNRRVLAYLLRRAVTVARRGEAVPLIGRLDEYAVLGTFYELENTAIPNSLPAFAHGSGFTNATRRTARRNALRVTILLWGVMGAGCFGFGAEFVAKHFGSGVEGAFVLDLIFLAGALFVIRAILAWQREAGERIYDLGWRRSTTAAAVVTALTYGLLWTALAYSRGGDPLAVPWQRPVMAAIGLVLAFAEDVATLGYFMEQLCRSGMSDWLQALTTGAMIGLYHGVVGFHYSVLYAFSSAILFGILSVIFLWGKRSLTPTMLAHSMVHVLGDPTLTGGILVGLLALE
jgi:Type II CAAX prenyl endopeptidase Rce1-like